MPSSNKIALYTSLIAHQLITPHDQTTDSSRIRPLQPRTAHQGRQGQPTTVGHWHLLSAAAENISYVTRTCLLQGRNSPDEEWQTLDMIDGNRANVVDRDFQPATVRYLRLYVVSPTQGRGGATRIYELSVY